jgi:hypothetical protein
MFFLVIGVQQIFYYNYDYKYQYHGNLKLIFYVIQ